MKSLDLSGHVYPMPDEELSMVGWERSWESMMEMKRREDEACCRLMDGSSGGSSGCGEVVLMSMDDSSQTVCLFWILSDKGSG
jgi:hypothetical protein